MRFLQFRLPVVVLAATMISGLSYGEERSQAQQLLIPAPSELNNLPLAFVANADPAKQNVRFEARGPSGQLWFTPAAVTLAVPDGTTRVDVVRIAFDGADPQADLLGLDLLPGKVHIFRGSAATEWRQNIPTYAAISYPELYPGIDLRYEGTEDTLKSTFAAAPGADWTRIGWRYEGAESVDLDARTGDLQIRLGGGQEMVEHAPVAWQEIGGARRPVEVRFRIDAEGVVRFGVGDHDPAHALILDPVIDYSSFAGGLREDHARAVAVDSSGMVYVAGGTTSLDFPTTPGAYDQTATPIDAFVMKINPLAVGAASLIWSTYLGGGAAMDIAVDTGGNIYVAGVVMRNGFPTTVSAYQPTRPGGEDGYLTKFAPDGASLLYSTYLGGSSNDTLLSMAIDTAGNAYVGGVTISTNFPTTANAYQTTMDDSAIFASRIDTLASGSASLVYSTYFYAAQVTDVAADEGNLYITGLNGRSGFPVTANAYQSTLKGTQDAFLLRFNTNESGTASLAYSSHFGGSNRENFDEIARIASDGTGVVYLFGTTDSTDLPIVNGFQTSFRGGGGDQYLAKLDTNSTGTQGLLYSSYYGGQGFEFPRGIVVAPESGLAILTGVADSPGFPLVDTIFTPPSTRSATFIAKVETTLSGPSSLVLSTFNPYYDAMPYALDVDTDGRVYLVGTAASANLPIVNGFQTTWKGDEFDAFVLAYRFSAPLTVIRTADLNPALLNTPLTLTTTISNPGPDTATSVTVTETLPSGLDFVEASSSRGTCSQSAGMVTCQINPLRPNQSAAVTLVVVPAAEGTASFSQIVDALERSPLSVDLDLPVMEFVDQIISLSTPPDDTFTSNPRPAFTWGAASGAVTYEIQLGQTDPPTATLVTTSANYTPDGELIDVPHFWRVRALNGNSEATEWSETWMVTIVSASNEAPRGTLIISATREVTLTWNPIKEGADYDIEIATSPNMSNPVFEQRVNSLSVTTTLPQFGVFYWRVRSQSGGITGGWSGINRFTLAAP